MTPQILSVEKVRSAKLHDDLRDGSLVTPPKLTIGKVLNV